MGTSSLFWCLDVGVFLVFGVWCLVFALAGCGGRAKPTAQQNKNFFTSGSKEADQRASQRMAREEQLSGESEKSETKGSKKDSEKQLSPTGRISSTNQAAQARGKTSLYERLGASAGISNIISDFMPRALNDPRVNWDRKDVSGGLFHHGETIIWKPTPQNVAILQKHLVEFIALATGGPARYDGKEIKSTHANMKISNPEFDAVVGDLKASLDRLQIPNTEQKEVLAIIESTRPQIVTQQ